MEEVNIGEIIVEEEVLISDLQLDIEKIYPELEDLEVIPEKKVQKFKSDKYGYNEVTVLGKTVTLQDKEIDKNGIYEADSEYDGLGKINVDIQPSLGTKIVNKDGTYKAIDDGLDGYSEFSVETGGSITDYFYDGKIQLPYSALKINMFLKAIPQLDVSGTSNLSGLFQNCSNLRTIPQVDISNATNTSYLCYGCRELIRMPELDFSKTSTMQCVLQYCYQLHEIADINAKNATTYYAFAQACNNLRKVGLLDMSSTIGLTYCFDGCSQLRDLAGFKNIGKAYSTSSAENTSTYRLDLHASQYITHDSLINVMNNLYDIKSAGVKAQQLILGSYNTKKLTEEEIAIATSKGWSVS